MKTKFKTIQFYKYKDWNRIAMIFAPVVAIRQTMNFTECKIIESVFEANYKKLTPSEKFSIISKT